MKIKKTLLSALWLLCCLFVGHSAAAYADNLNIKTSENSNKFYIDASQVILNEGGIFIFADGDFCPIEALHHDDQGFYVNMAPYVWTCAKGHIVPMYKYPCPKCGNGPPGDPRNK